MTVLGYSLLISILLWLNSQQKMHGRVPNTQCGALNVGQKQSRNGFQALLACHEWLLLFATEDDMQTLPKAVAHSWVCQAATSCQVLQTNEESGESSKGSRTKMNCNI